MEELIDEDLMLPVALRHLGKIRKAAAIKFDAFLDQFPTDSRDDLLSPGIEEPGKRHAAGGHRAAKLAASLDQEDARASPPCLDRGDRTGGPAADHEHIHLIGDLEFSRVRNRGSACMKG